MQMYSSNNQRKPLTERQQSIYQFIQRYSRQHGFPPTIQEICREFDFSSTNAATQYLHALEKKGYVKRTVKGASRGIQILDDHGLPRTPDFNEPLTRTEYSGAGSGVSPLHVQQIAPKQESIKNLLIIGRGTSTNPLSVFLSPRGQLNLDISLFNPSASDSAQFFAAFVEDDGMKTRGIQKGDVVIAQQQYQANDGDIVIFQAQDISLIRLMKISGTISEFIASEPGFPAIPFQGNDPALSILGVVIGLVRKV